MDGRRFAIVVAIAIAPCTIIAQRTGSRPPDARAGHGAPTSPRPGASHRGRRVLPRGGVGIVDVALPVDSAELEPPPAESAVPPPPPAAGPSSIQPPLQPTALPGAPRGSLRGNLWLAVEPNSAQVYVDGFYVGTVEESHRTPTGLSLAPGWHRLEFRAPGYVTPAVNVTVEPSRMARYEGELKKLP